MLRQLLVPLRRDLAAAEKVVADSDIISCHSFFRWHNVWLTTVARRRGVPFWFVPHGILDPYVFTYDRMAKRLFMRMGGERFLRDASAVVCATRREYEKLARFFPQKPHAVIPWPLEDEDFRKRDESARVATREKLGVADDATALLYFGRLDPMKRPLETIDAVAQCRDRKCHLVIVGNESGVTAGECRARARFAGIEERVHVVGPAFGREKYAFMDACDAYISLSHRENFNFTAAECIASGLPVILSAGNDLSYDLADVGCGWMLNTADSIPTVIDLVISVGDAERQERGRNGQAWASQRLRRNIFDLSVRQFAKEMAG